MGWISFDWNFLGTTNLVCVHRELGGAQSRGGAISKHAHAPHKPCHRDFLRAALKKATNTT